MLRTSLVLLLCLGVLLPASAMAKKDHDRVRATQVVAGYEVFRWRGERVVVLDYSDDGATVAETVEDFNRVLPKAAPELVYTAMAARSCVDAPPALAGEIVVCSGGSGSANWQPLVDGRIVYGRVSVADAGWDGDRGMVACHEFMHVLSAVKDEHDIRNLTPRDSCVHGLTSDPGAWDIALLKALYGKKRKHR